MFRISDDEILDLVNSMIATLEKDNLAAKVSKDILDNLNDRRHMVMKHGEALDLFSGDEE